MYLLASLRGLYCLFDFFLIYFFNILLLHSTGKKLIFSLHLRSKDILFFNSIDNEVKMMNFSNDEYCRLQNELFYFYELAAKLTYNDNISKHFYVPHETSTKIFIAALSFLEN